MKRHVGSLGLVVLLIRCFIHAAPVAAASLRPPDVSLGIRFDNSNIRAGATDRRAMEILLQAPEDDGFIDRAAAPPMNIALVIDRSGSMSGEGKMEYVKEAARSIVERLSPRDSIALITFDNEAEVVIPMQAVRRTRHLIDRINRIYPRGGTNLGAGLLAGYREIEKRRRPTTVNRVILLSDGLANRGITSIRELSGITAGNYQEGVSISTLGVGYGFNEDLMTALASDGGGWYYYIDHAARIPEIMAREFSTMQCLVASNITLRIELTANVGIDRVIGNRYVERGRVVEYNVGELSVGERRRYMLHLDIPELREGRHSIGKVSMHYVKPGKGKRQVVSQPVYLHAMRDERRVGQGRNDEVVERSYIFEVNEARKRAARAVDRGNMQEAEQVLAEVEKRLDRAPVKTERLSKEKSSIREYATAVRSRPEGGRLRSLQKKVKHRTYALEGC